MAVLLLLNSINMYGMLVTAGHGHVQITPDAVHQSINQCYICSNEIHREFMPALG
jgi:hypothetical protein